MFLCTEGSKTERGYLLTIYFMVHTAFGFGSMEWNTEHSVRAYGRPRFCTYMEMDNVLCNMCFKWGRAKSGVALAPANVPPCGFKVF